MTAINNSVSTASITSLDRSPSGTIPLVAVVHTVDSVRFVVTSTCRQELLQELSRYACENALDRLWPEDAAHVAALVAAGAPEAAIAHYFDTVGQRWDAEWLVTTNFNMEASV